MADHVDFLQAILANSDEDAPRFIYADWLEEQGDPRGELIRLLCTLAPLGLWDPRRQGIEQQAQALLKRHGAQWLGDLNDMARAWKFERGLPVLTLTATDFLRHGQRLGEAGVQSVRLIDVKPHVADLAACPHLGQLSRLDVAEQFILNDGDIALLAASPYLKNLTALEIGYNPIGDIGLGALAASPYLGNLTRLGVSFCQITPKGIAALAASQYVRGLRHLSLDKNPLENQGVAVLAAWPGLEQLTHLDLSSTTLGYDGARALLTTPYLHQLEALSLGNNRLGQAKWFGTDGLASLFHQAEFPHLSRLMLGNNELYDQTIMALATAPMLASVKELYLAANQISDAGIVVLAGSPRVARLEGLVLGRNGNITQIGAKALASSPHLTGLRYLSLTDATLGLEGLHALRTSTTLPMGMRLFLGTEFFRFGIGAPLREAMRQRFDLGAV